MKIIETVDIPGVSYHQHISSIIATVDLAYVESLDSPYNLQQDQKNMSKRILYFESSRGCPFHVSVLLIIIGTGTEIF